MVLDIDLSNKKKSNSFFENVINQFLTISITG